MYKATKQRQVSLERQKQAVLHIKCPPLSHLGWTTASGRNNVFTPITWLIYNSPHRHFYKTQFGISGLSAPSVLPGRFILAVIFSSLITASLLRPTRTPHKHGSSIRGANEDLLHQQQELWQSLRAPTSYQAADARLHSHRPPPVQETTNHKTASFPAQRTRQNCAWE